MTQQIGPKALIRHLRENAPLWAERLPKLPNLFFEVLEQAKKGELHYKLDEQQLKQIRHEIRSANRRHFAAITGTGLIVCAAIISALDGYAKAMFGPLPLLSWVTLSFGIALLFAGWPRR